MALQAETKDCTGLSDSELSEMADICADGTAGYERHVRDSLNAAEEKARTVGAHMVMIGILPTLAEGHLGLDTLSANPRYRLLSEQIMAARGEDITIPKKDISEPVFHHGQGGVREIVLARCS